MEFQNTWLSLIPALSVVLFALFTKRTFEALLVGAIVGYMIYAGTDFFSVFTHSLIETAQDESVIWISLVCALFGSLINLLIRSGGSMAFGNWLLTFVKNRKQALLATWLLGLSIFIDDYLNALTVGTSMKKITDKFGVSREMLAYVVDSTAAPICVLIPLSTWSIYISGLLESNGVAMVGSGVDAYLQIIPYLFYSWLAVMLVPLVAMNWFPLLGPMRAAEKRARETGQLQPPKSEFISLDLQEQQDEGIQPKIRNFLWPMVVLVAATLYFKIDVLKGIMVAVLFATIFYRIQGLFNFSALSKAVFDGIKSMIYPIGIILFSFVLKDVNDKLELSNYVIGGLEPWLDGSYLPVIAFLSLSIVTFATGSFWGVFAITFPIIIPLAQALEVNTFLALGAVVSSGAFGSHACFYGDSTVLSATSTGCNNMAHALTQLPYSLVVAAISSLLFLYLGFVM